MEAVAVVLAVTQLGLVWRVNTINSFLDRLVEISLSFA
jgi:hypothetical protein